MWEEIQDTFEKYPARLSIISKMLELGLRIGEDKKIYCGDLKINDASLAKVADVDRRAVKTTVNAILEDEKLSKLFKNIIPAGTSLKNIGQILGLGVIEIEAERNNPNYGILAEASAVFASKKIAIRQAHADDYKTEKTPRLTIVTTTPIPGELINEFLKINGVKRVSIS